MPISSSSACSVPIVLRADQSAWVSDTGADLVLFHCTAVSPQSETLEKSISERVARASGKPVTATSEALVAALRVLSAKRIVMVSTYP